MLEEAGSYFKDLVSAIVFRADINKLVTLDSEWQDYFPNPQAYPYRAAVEVAALVSSIQLLISANASKD